MIGLILIFLLMIFCLIITTYNMDKTFFCRVNEETNKELNRGDLKKRINIYKLNQQTNEIALYVNGQLILTDIGKIYLEHELEKITPIDIPKSAIELLTSVLVSFVVAMITTFFTLVSALPQLNEKVKENGFTNLIGNMANEIFLQALLTVLIIICALYIMYFNFINRKRIRTSVHIILNYLTNKYS
ncbi:MAG: hypothetical protein KM312_13010 [Hydrogenibacillus schlegelii]|uniref:Uncharacterized protein n=1 Tax=Hydrogenibacillus schlegelii TaxID=1484 RepID=A0A947CYJ5_HYDSH|nr:hypothetical protein [Hydrogenibacillus schlegelii]